MTSKQLLFCLAGSLALASCSSEPSDWRPDKKVSVDMVAPGTRSSQNFDVAEEHAQAKAHGNGGVVEHPISSHVDALDRDEKPAAEAAMSANAEGAEHTKAAPAAAPAAKAADSVSHE